jgi:galactokinase
VARSSRVKAWRAPGRVNLIGEHTDYNDGFVLPIAIALECRIAVSSIRKKEIRLASKQMEGEVAVPLADLAAAQPKKHWSDYSIGVAKELLSLGFDLKPVKLTIDASVPTGSGLSSSAALEVATALALLDGREIGKIELAKLAQRAERNFVGMPCGIMDQYASVFGESHRAILLDCRSTTHVSVPIPEAVDLVAVNTMVKHELGSSAYRERVAQCQEALSHFPGRKALRDVTFEELERAARNIPEVPLARARHVILECWRVEQFHQAAQAGDLDRMGKLFVESHRSLQHDYEVSCVELDSLVDIALTLDGVYGARMTGGGFGGCTVNLVAKDKVDSFESEIRRRYKDKWNLDPLVYRCTPSAGAGPLA